MDSRLSEALQILCVTSIEEVTPAYVNELVILKPNQESWIKYAFHYVKMIVGDSLPKDDQVFQDTQDDEYELSEDYGTDESEEIDYEGEIGTHEGFDNVGEISYQVEFEPYLPDRITLWNIRRRNLENLINYLPADTEIADDFEMLTKYYALEVIRKSLMAHDLHEFTYDSFEESLLEMSNYEKLTFKILEELKFIGIDNDEGAFGIRFNKYIREFATKMNEING